MDNYQAQSQMQPQFAGPEYRQNFEVSVPQSQRSFMRRSTCSYYTSLTATTFIMISSIFSLGSGCKQRDAVLIIVGIIFIGVCLFVYYSLRAEYEVWLKLKYWLMVVFVVFTVLFALALLAYIILVATSVSQFGMQPDNGLIEVLIGGVIAILCSYGVFYCAIWMAMNLYFEETPFVVPLPAEINAPYIPQGVPVQAVQGQISRPTPSQGVPAQIYGQRFIAYQ